MFSTINLHLVCGFKQTKMHTAKSLVHGRCCIQLEIGGEYLVFINVQILITLRRNLFKPGRNFAFFSLIYKHFHSVCTMIVRAVEGIAYCIHMLIKW